MREKVMRFAGSRSSGGTKPPSMDDAELSRLIDELLSRGVLPNERAWWVSAGYADGSKLCAVCSSSIVRDDTLYEVHVGARTGPRVVHMHVRCFVAWERALGRGKV